MAASGQFDRGIDPETPGAGERGRTSDLLITNDHPANYAFYKSASVLTSQALLKASF